MNAIIPNPQADLDQPMPDTLLQGTTGTGLDAVIDLLGSDRGLTNRISGLDLSGGMAAADGMSGLIVGAIRALGVGTDGVITTADVYAMSARIRADHLTAFTAFHGNDEDGSETGYHLVQNDGGQARLSGQNGIDGMIDSVFHIGFAIRCVTSPPTRLNVGFIRFFLGGGQGVITPVITFRFWFCSVHWRFSRA